MTSAASSAIEIQMNNRTVETECCPVYYQRNNHGSLASGQKTPDISIQWNNSSKTVTITREGATITLVAGQKTAKVGNKK
ncbi:stalk domain-containing protein [Paenibacillus graminis]|nr:stalk domain-containing protein [Paenibacillus graminis]MEC0168239.1 stalk domain-containing protein [Paenibacillus graminis]